MAERSKILKNTPRSTSVHAGGQETSNSKKSCPNRSIDEE